LYRGGMRGGFVHQLAERERDIVGELEAAANTLATVAAAVRAPAQRRTATIAHDGRALKASATRVHVDLVNLTACQTPVAGDLRLVLAMIELAHHAALIANQFVLISQQLTAINPAAIDRADAADTLIRMSELASAQLRKAAGAFRTRDLAAARELDADDDILDRLNRDLCDRAVQLDVCAEERELALRYILVGRSLERIGDNAVDIAEQAEFLITAELRQYSDASQPRRRSIRQRRETSAE
jgi:phosphate transport system protein